MLSHPGASWLLGTCDEKRIPHAAKVIGFAIDLDKVICVPDPAKATERDANMAATAGATVPPPTMSALDAGLFEFGTPAAGELFVQGRLGPCSPPARFDDVHGTGWRLVTDGQLPVDDELRAWFESIGGAVVAIDPSVDADHAYRS